MNKYTPEGSAKNALERVVFIVQFAKDFTVEDFARLDDKTNGWREVLPRRSQGNAVLLQPGSSRVSFDEEKVISLSFEALKRDGSIELGLRFEESRILFIVGNYTHWEEIWPQVSEHLGKAISIIPEENEIVSFASEYADLFRAKGEYEEFEADKILRRGSKYIPDHIFDRKENFHFHTGFFNTHSDPADYRILTRINADLRDNENEKSRDLSIILFHQVMPINKPSEEEIKLPKEIVYRGLKNFSFLHDVDKEVLREIVNDQMANDIGLMQ